MIDENLERKLLEALQNEEGIEKTLAEESDWRILFHLSNIRENLLEWYEFDPKASLLEIGAECGALTGLFCRRVSRVVAVEASDRDNRVNMARNRQYGNLTVLPGDFFDLEIEEKFDYVTMIDVLAYAGRHKDSADPYADMLKKARACLKPGGLLILAMENRYGLKYFAGAPEDHTGRCFEGLENYAGTDLVKTFAHPTLENMLLEAGFSQNRFYYPMPDHKLPSEIYSYRCMPSFGSLRYPCVAYDRDRYELLDERLVFDSLCEDGMFGAFANSFLVFSQNGDGDGNVSNPDTVVYAKYNRQRMPAFQVSTRIVEREDGSRFVEKKALNAQAGPHVQKLSQNRKKLLASARQFDTLDTKAKPPMPVEIVRNEDGRAVFSYVEGTSLAKEVNRGLSGRKEFLKALHHAVESIYGVFFQFPQKLVDFVVTEEFEQIFGSVDWNMDGEECDPMKSLPISNIDSILSNFIRSADGGLVCLDYEWVFDFPVPLEYLMYRTIFYYYSENVHYIKMSEPELWAEFGLPEAKIQIFRRMDDHFQQYVHGRDRRCMYTGNYVKKTFSIGKNLQNGESWFLSIVNDIQNLNVHLGPHRRDLVTCHVKTRRKSEVWEKCKRKVPAPLKRPLKKWKEALKKRVSHT